MSGPTQKKKLRGCNLTISIDVTSRGKGPLPVKAGISRLNGRTRVSARTTVMRRKVVATRRQGGHLLLHQIVASTNCGPLHDR